MNDELPKSKNVSPSRRSLEERLAHRPDVLARLHELADTLDQSVTDDCTADTAEARVSAQVRQLAQELLGQWDRAAQRVREHYGLDVTATAVRQHTLAHGAQISALEVTPPKRAARTLVTQLDGSLIPIMVPPTHSEDRRYGKQLIWREARLCLARPKDSATPCYGATLGSVTLAGARWRATAQAAGLGPRTHVHGVGDGAAWILTQFQEQFGAQGDYLLDFYHVSEYLAAAATVIQPQNPERWRRRQQSRLLENKVSAVLRPLAPHLETETQTDAPVRAAHRYLSERRAHLDYVGARTAGLEIGSGEIESGHRHVIQQRLKLAGSWWKETNAEAMLGLRVARANQLWSCYWSTPKPALN